MVTASTRSCRPSSPKRQRAVQSFGCWCLSFGMIWVTHMFAHCSRHAQVEAFPWIFPSLPDGRLRFNVVKLLVLPHRVNYRPQMHVNFFFNNILSSGAFHRSPLNEHLLSLELSHSRGSGFAVCVTYSCTCCLPVLAAHMPDSNLLYLF